MATMRLLIPALLLCSGTALSAQRTWIVNNIPGASADFARVPDAVDAAQPGDTILIEPGLGGSYEFPIYLEKGLTIRGHGPTPIAYHGGVVVQNIAAGESVLLDNLEASNTSSRLIGYLLIRDCEASVAVDRFQVLVQGFRIALRVERCRSVFIRDSFIVPGFEPANVIDSRVTFQDCTIIAALTSGRAAGYEDCALYARSSRGYPTPTHLTISGGYIKGGDGYYRPPPWEWIEPPQPGVYIAGDILERPAFASICNGAIIEGGMGVRTSDALGVHVFRRDNLEVDPSCQATVLGNRHTVRELTSVTTSPMIRGTDLQARVTGPSHGAVALFASGPSASPPLDLGIGTVVIDPIHHVIVGASALGSGRTWTATVPVPLALPDSFALIWQATSLDPQGRFEIGLATANVAR